MILSFMDAALLGVESFYDLQWLDEELTRNSRAIKSKLFGILGKFRTRVVRTEEQVLRALSSVLGPNTDRDVLNYVVSYGVPLGKTGALEFEFNSKGNYIIRKYE